MNNLVKKYNLSKRIVKIIFALLAMSLFFFILYHVIRFGINTEKETKFILVIISGVITLVFFLAAFLLLYFTVNKTNLVIAFVIYRVYVLKKEKAIKQYKKSSLWKNSIKLWNYEIENNFNSDVEAWIEHNWALKN